MLLLRDRLVVLEVERAARLAREDLAIARSEEVGQMRRDEDVAGTRAEGVVQAEETTRVVTPQETHELAPCREDYFEQFTDLFVASFHGFPGSDVESWFRQVNIAFRQIGTPEELRLDLTNPPERRCL